MTSANNNSDQLDADCTHLHEGAQAVEEAQAARMSMLAGFPCLLRHLQG